MTGDGRDIVTAIVNDALESVEPSARREKDFSTLC
jgi:hypothetical protein